MPSPARSFWLRRDILAVLLLAALVRAGLLFAWHDRLQQDPDAYRLFAETLVETGTYAPGYTLGTVPEPSAHRPPLYPLLLTLCLRSPAGFVPSVAVLHWMLGIATVVLIIGLARRIPKISPAFTGLLVAFDPILLNQSVLVMTETLAAFFAALAVVLLTAAHRQPSVLSSAVAGAALGLAALCRPTFLILLAAAGLILILLVPAKLRLRVGAAFFLAGLLVLTPWIVRNARQLGKPIATTTHGGYTLHLANNPAFYDYLQHGAWGTVWQLPPGVEPGHYLNDLLREQNRLPAAGAPQRELVIDQAHYDAAVELIRREPAMFLYASLVRVGRFWQLVPHRTSPEEGIFATAMRCVTGVWYLAEFLLAAIGLWRVRRSLLDSPWIWSLLLVASFMLPHTIYWTNMRMRAPLMPLVALAAAAGAQPLRRPRLHSQPEA